MLLHQKQAVKNKGAKYQQLTGGWAYRMSPTWNPWTTILAAIAQVKKGRKADGERADLATETA